MATGYRPKHRLSARMMLGALSMFAPMPGFIRFRSDEDPRGYSAYKPYTPPSKPLPEAYAYRPTGSKRSRRRRRGKSKAV